ncbi:phosphatidylglycerophosphatase A [Desulfovibrio sp. X2]|uniref:phosphatidylglycerophosphatase A family protein n=1 Tax=Desulfovibrio sp. X2 TaxID=941449 RepID=UPI000358F2D7|nr:phosphatidylglycerophosphatase A [Desulfovibrio sp. X2]EPR37046.1 phosphatidylglycerophosphatase A [Desulfovibrio sp. X2]
MQHDDSELPRPETSLDAFCLSLSTLGYVGRVRPGPGTAGSLVAALVAPTLFLSLPLAGRLAVAAALFVVGGLAATRAEKILGRKDPSCVIIDEVLGQWLAFLPFAALPWWQIGAGFCFFRLFDIAKPWPVKSSERWLPDGFGIMLDDVLAGLYALACMALLRHWL